MLSTLHAERITIEEEGPDGTFLMIKTEEVGTISVNIQDIILEFEAEVYNKLHAYALEAQHARTAVASGVTLTQYLGEDDDETGLGYALDDPKHPTYHERMTIASDWKADQVRNLLRGDA